jgi:release factor glutamine methyltransferase
LIAEGRAPLPDEAASRFETFVARRLTLEPVAYIIGEREFYGLRFFVDRRVLVPRPETELLVERALAEAATLARSPLRIADIGAGSGCIAVTLAAHLPHARIYAVDRSADALAVARANAAYHARTAQITFLEGDLLTPLPEPVDLLVSNPPYTIMHENEPGVVRHEPALALDGGADGLDVYRRLLAQAPAHVAPGGAILLEIGAAQGAAVSALAAASFPGAAIRVERDLAGRDRVVVIQLKVEG